MGLKPRRQALEGDLIRPRGPPPLPCPCLLCIHEIRHTSFWLAVFRLCSWKISFVDSGPACDDLTPNAGLSYPILSLVQRVHSQERAAADKNARMQG